MDEEEETESTGQGGPLFPHLHSAKTNVSIVMAPVSSPLPSSSKVVSLCHIPLSLLQFTLCSLSLCLSIALIAPLFFSLADKHHKHRD